MRDDEMPWLGIAKKVLAGKFDSAGGSHRSAVVMGLRTLHHPDAKAAVKHLEELKEKKGKKRDPVTSQ